MVVSNRNLLFQRSIFRCYVSFREGNWDHTSIRTGLHWLLQAGPNFWNFQVDRIFVTKSGVHETFGPVNSFPTKKKNKNSSLERHYIGIIENFHIFTKNFGATFWIFRMLFLQKKKTLQKNPAKNKPSIRQRISAHMGDLGSPNHIRIVIRR